MFYKILLSIFLAAFVAACSTTPKVTTDSSGSGSTETASSSSSSIEPASGDAAILEELMNTPLGGPSIEPESQEEDSSEDSSSVSVSAPIEPGSQEDLIVNVGDRVFFDYDSAELKDAYKDLLHLQSAWFKKHNILEITIEGHCDERGTREYNLALGEKRAQAVKNYLNGLSVFPVINTISYGKERPAVLGSIEGAWSQNRRSVTKVH